MSADLLADQMRPLTSAYFHPSNISIPYYKPMPRKSGRDEIDNNTYSDQLLAVCKPRYTMSEIFHREDERLKTFDSWPCEWLDKKELAMTGMFYMGESDKTKCYFCEVEIGCWEREDQPVPEHLRWSPNCPLLRRRTTNNVPINCEVLERLLPPPSYDICGLNEHIEIRRNAFPEGTIPVANIPPASPAMASSSGSSHNTGTFYPEYPEYAIETARLRTFAEWPINMKQKPAQLAEAGFFYTGVGDRVKCFSCGGGLKDWDDNDEPWEQHALWMGKCRYVKLMKGDTYIETVILRFKKSISNASEEGEPQNVAAATSSVSAAAVLSVSSVTGPKETEQQQTGGATTQTLAANSCNAPEQNRKSCSVIPEEKLCKICYANEYNTAFLPCGHVVACAKCASSVTKCPLCRKAFVDVMRVYFS